MVSSGTYAGYTGTSYGYNYFISGPGENHPYLLNFVESPDKTCLFAESRNVPVARQGYLPGNPLYLGLQPAARHLGGANFLMFAGNVIWSEEYYYEPESSVFWRGAVGI